MEKIDARKLSSRELSEKKKIAIKLREKGVSNKEVAQIVGYQHKQSPLIILSIKKKETMFLKLKMLGVLKSLVKDLAMNKNKESSECL